MKRLIATIVLSLAAVLGAPRAAPADAFRDGLQALQDGNHGAAVSIFRGLAEQGDRNGQFMMGVMREEGFGVARDYAAAADWYLKAAEAGLASAQFNLGVYYQLGQGVRKSPAEAVRWLTLAALQGHASAQNNLATFYLTGEGIEKDAVEAWKWYDLAASGVEGEARDRVIANRDKVAATLTPDQLAAARRRVADFRPQKR